MIVKRLFLIIWISMPLSVSLGDEPDSLDQVLEATKNTKRKVDILNVFNREYIRGDTDRPINRFRTALQLAEEIRYIDGIAMAHENMANYFFRNNLIDSATFHYQEALKIYQEQTDDGKTGNALYNLASIFYYVSDYDDALEYARGSLEMFQIIGDVTHMAGAYALLCDILSSSGFMGDAIENCLSALNIYTEIESLGGQSRLLNAIGNIYLELDQLGKSTAYFNQAYYIAELDNNPSLLAASLRNLGQYYLRIDEYDKALESFTKSLEIVQKIPDPEREGFLHMDLGITLTGMGNYEEALDNLQEALAYADSSYNAELKAGIYAELGRLYSATEKYDIAIVFYKQSLFEAQKIDADPILQRCYKNISDFYDKLNDAENALKYYKLYLSHKDSLLSNLSAMQIAEAEALYNLQEKDKQIELLQNENKLREIEAGEKKLINIWLISVLIFVFIITLILFRQYRLQNKVNKVLNEQKNAINQQKLEIELQKENIEKTNNILAEKNRQITDSLEYAKRIQMSLLPDDRLLKEKFKEAFVWYLPRDIVGGDFYWYTELKDALCLVIMDCSGHGVPGAFMTVLANTLLNRLAVEINSNDSPDLVLKFLDENVKKELNQQGIQLSALEGIDLAVCMLDTQKKQLKFAGAKIPLYHYSAGILSHIKGNRYSVGGGNNSIKSFHVTSIDLKSGDVLYLASDGFQDQFGGDHGKKFMKTHFKELLSSIADLPLDKQSKKLKSVFHEWKNFNLQTDDVLVMGIRV